MNPIRSSELRDYHHLLNHRAVLGIVVQVEGTGASFCEELTTD